MSYSDSSGAAANPNDKVDAARGQVEEVMGIMRDNVEKVMERDAKLSDLDARAVNLQESSLSFARNGQRLRKKYWWENLKMKLVIGGVLVLVIVIIVVVVVVQTKSDSSSSTDPGTATTKSSVQ